ncbi:hypothetical protein PSHT_16489 [Puccinia striiformis]|uniref:Tyr recombinase domain-containing protein n=1 Tax=Puccinia striiformis TaxID=27350 RepID=A0A2S4U9S1_9BASI|nr:hypothetical protein PSHT_16489 [Puccinia striiformis]
MKSPLCPVDAVERRRGATTGDSNSLFGWDGPHGRINLTKRRVNTILTAVWHNLNRPHLTGHSFRVGGATLRNAVGIDINEIKALGRWTTDCYRRYIKPMSRKEVVKVSIHFRNVILLKLEKKKKGKRRFSLLVRFG